MFRTRLAGAALLTFTLLPGCGLLCGDRGLCSRWCGARGPVNAIPVSYPGDFGAMPYPADGGMIYGAPPVYGSGPVVVPGATVIPGDTLPPPVIPRTRGGVDEGRGRQFELEGASRVGPSGPALALPGGRIGN